MELFLCNKRKIVSKWTMHHNSAVSKASFDFKILKSLIININENYYIRRRHRLLSQTTKQPLNNFENMSNFEGLCPILVA